MTTALVGPLQRVAYNGVTEYRDLPRNTMDIRYDACGNHHLACDCREARQAEDTGEYRARLAEIEAAIIAATAGHSTWAYSRDGMSIDILAQCKCAPCGIRRDLFIGYSDWVRAREQADRVLYPHEEIPF